MKRLFKRYVRPSLIAFKFLFCEEKINNVVESLKLLEMCVYEVNYELF